LVVGASDYVGAPRTVPASGHELESLNQTDFSIVSSASAARSITFRFHTSYTMIFAGEAEDRELYFSTPSITLFQTQTGTKSTFTGNRNTAHSFQLGADGFSENGSAYRTQTLQSFDGYKQLQYVYNQNGGHLKIAGGRATGSGSSGDIYFATAQNAGEVDDQLQTHTVKAQISDAFQLIATGLSKPTCNSSNRFKLWPVAGGTGVADTFEVCMKNGSDTYAWVALATP
jgi:hypothetical protein